MVPSTHACQHPCVTPALGHPTFPLVYPNAQITFKSEKEIPIVSLTHLTEFGNEGSRDHQLDYCNRNPSNPQAHGSLGATALSGNLREAGSLLTQSPWLARDAVSQSVDKSTRQHRNSQDTGTDSFQLQFSGTVNCVSFFNGKTAPEAVAGTLYVSLSCSPLPRRPPTHFR